VTDEARWRIREAKADDALALAQILRRSFQDVAREFGLSPETFRWHPSNYQDQWIRDDMAHGITFFILEVTGLPVGCVGMTTPREGACEMKHLAVLPEYRHKGLGKALVDYAIARATSLGLSRLDLDLMAANARLRRWYEGMGFAYTGTRTVEGIPFAIGSMALKLPELLFAELAEDMREAFVDYGREFRKAGEPFRREDMLRAEADWPAYIRGRLDFAAGRNLPEGCVPQLDYCLMRGSQILGTCRLRPRLNEALNVTGGHIGYDVRPSERGKGYATLMLRLALDKARKLGLTRVLLTCDEDNPASARVIRKCGGVLENEVISPRTGKPSQRYWIELSPPQL